jgi:hypothetical protein
MMFKSRSRVIAIDPTSEGFAFAVLEGPDRLIDWGTTKVPKLRRSEYLKRVDALFERYQPKGLVLESPRGKDSRRSPRVAGVIRSLELLAWRYHVKVSRVSRGQVRAAFAPAWRKHEIAKAISRWFPVLEDSVPPARKPWQAEEKCMNVFDAISFALTAFGAVQGEVR